MLGVHPICSHAKFIGLIYALAGSHSEWPAWLSTEAEKEAQVEINVSLVHIGREDVKLLQHFCRKCLILDWCVTNNIPYFYLRDKSLLLLGFNGIVWLKIHWKQSEKGKLRSLYTLHLGQAVGDGVVSGQVQFSACRTATGGIGILTLLKSVQQKCDDAPRRVHNCITWGAWFNPF